MHTDVLCNVIYIGGKIGNNQNLTLTVCLRQLWHTNTMKLYEAIKTDAYSLWNKTSDKMSKIKLTICTYSRIFILLHETYTERRVEENTPACY
jgi:hypothetical protein